MSESIYEQENQEIDRDTNDKTKKKMDFIGLEQHNLTHATKYDCYFFTLSSTQLILIETCITFIALYHIYLEHE